MNLKTALVPNRCRNQKFKPLYHHRNPNSRCKSHLGALERMISADQEVVSQNMETVERLYRAIRPQANYEKSLEQLKRIKAYGKRSKSGIMLGLGETDGEVYNFWTIYVPTNRIFQRLVNTSILPKKI